jgi:hypothetical protein
MCPASLRTCSSLGTRQTGFCSLQGTSLMSNVAHDRLTRTSHPFRNYSAEPFVNTFVVDVLV